MSKIFNIEMYSTYMAFHGWLQLGERKIFTSKLKAALLNRVLILTMNQMTV